jgi:T4-like virus tail tube protein gp19
MRQVRYLAAVAAVAGVFSGADARSADQRAFAAGNVAVEIEGVRAKVREAAGGAAYADVISEALGADHVVRKHIGPPKYEPISLTVGADMPRALATWVSDTLSLKFATKNGAILGLDYNMKEQSRRTFANALLTDVVFPELDASSKDAAYITLKMSPENTRVGTPSGAAVAVSATPAPKNIMASMFRLSIDGLETSHVTKIEAMDVKMKVGSDSLGVVREVTKAPGNLETPDLVFYVSESHADSIAKWHEDFVVKGSNGPDKEKNGKIDVLNASGQAIYTIELQHMGITHFTPEPLASSEDSMRMVRVEMYVEQMKFTPGTMAQ